MLNLSLYLAPASSMYISGSLMEMFASSVFETSLYRFVTTYTVDLTWLLVWMELIHFHNPPLRIKNEHNNGAAKNKHLRRRPHICSEQFQRSPTLLFDQDQACIQIYPPIFNNITQVSWSMSIIRMNRQLYNPLSYVIGLIKELQRLSHVLY